MSDTTGLNEYFASPGQATLPDDVTTELESTMRLHSLSAEELFFKWESYSIKMGSENTKLDYDTARAFKKDVQESLERETRGKTHIRGSEKKALHATPRASGQDDVFGMMGVTPASRHPTTITGSTKRKAPYETPLAAKMQRSGLNSSPTGGRNTNVPKGTKLIPFAERQNPDQIIETLNEHLQPFEPPIAPSAEPRVKSVSNTDLKKFSYKPLAMHLSEASEMLDERIEEFLELIKKHHDVEDSGIGSAASKGTKEIVTVGRIASDTPEGKPNAACLVIEMSRRVGAGLRTPLKFEPQVAAEFFPGQIVALRGINASGAYFSVSEVLELPRLVSAASAPAAIEASNERLGITDEDEPSASNALNILVSSGPYTPDDNLDYEPFHALCDKAQATCADVLVLVGPMLDIEHPLIATGDFDLPDDPSLEPDQATLIDAFRLLISEPLKRLTHALPSISIILIPSVREAINTHVSWPQDRISPKVFGLPKQVKTVCNPVTFSLNECMVAVSSADILNDLRLEEVTIGMKKGADLLARLSKHVLDQRHFFPMYPPVNRSALPKSGTEEGTAIGTPMDVSYLKLGEFTKQVNPDVLILPSACPPFVKVVEGVVVVNPGTLSKRKGAGTYSQFTVYPLKLSEDERALGQYVPHKLYERTRVDVIRI